MSFKDSILKLKNSMNHCRRDPASICDTLAKGFADLYANAEGGGSASQDYSTTEHVIGKWVDGTTDVYERTFIINSTINSGWNDITTDLTNATQIIDFRGTFKYPANNNAMQPIPHYETSDYCLYGGFKLDNGNIFLYKGSGFAVISDISITIRYLK